MSKNSQLGHQKLVSRPESGLTLNGVFSPALQITPPSFQSTSFPSLEAWRTSSFGQDFDQLLGLRPPPTTKKAAVSGRAPYSGQHRKLKNEQANIVRKYSTTVEGPHPVKMFKRALEPGCTKEFYRAEHLSRHKRKHTKKQPFKCHCSQAFGRLDNWRQHQVSAHKDDAENASTEARLVIFQKELQHQAKLKRAEANVLRHMERLSDTSNTASSPLLAINEPLVKLRYREAERIGPQVIEDRNMPWLSQFNFPTLGSSVALQHTYASQVV